jgi:diguanylate cyclase (GGDEF)-like protein/PAS domain S-box-containing protein
MDNKQSDKIKKIKCWEVFQCDKQVCPAYHSEDLRCWLFSGTHCRDEMQGKFLEKMELCLSCSVFERNMDISGMKTTLKIVEQQFKEFSSAIKERDRELEQMSMELALGLSESFEALKKIAAGDPTVRISEASEIELISKLKYLINLTAEEIGEIVELSHEIAIGLAEHFDVFHRVTKGDLNARVSGESKIDLLNALRNTSNEMIESMDREIVQRKIAEKTLNNSEVYQKAIMANIQAGVMVIDVEKHTIADINMAAENLIGIKREEIIGKECHKYVCPAEKGKCPITDLKQIVDRSERVLINIRGERIPILKTVVPLTIKGRKYLIESFIDISERKRMEEELKKLSITDNLTQTYNRTKYDEVIKREIARTKRSRSPLSVAMFDIDHFKKVNDAYGHAVGDYVLKTLSQIAKKNIRDIDYLIRWGGEEFVVIALDTDLSGAEVMADKIRKAIENYNFDKVARVTVSFGVTQFKQDDTDDSFIKKADDALYKAKEKGRNRVEVAV